MAHPEWCGKPCENCLRPCALDESMSCSPSCEGIDSTTGEPGSIDYCSECGAIYKEGVMCYEQNN